MPSSATAADPTRWRERTATLIRLVALPAAAAVILLDAHGETWTPSTLTVLLALAVVGAARGVYMGPRSNRVVVSASFLALMLAVVLLGPGAAAVVGVASMFATWLAQRYSLHHLANNLVTYTWFPLLAGLTFHWAGQDLSLKTSDPGYYLLVFGVFVFALALNALMVSGFISLESGCNWARQMGTMLRPVLAAELFSSLLTLLAVYLTVHMGLPGLALFAIILVVFQYLVGELLLSQDRAVELERQATTDQLTDLPNRHSFCERIEEEITAALPFGVLVIDVARLKEINDTLGHECGDSLLRQLATRLASRFDSNSAVARLGGDEFAVLAHGDNSQIERHAANLIAVLQEPASIDGILVELGSSVGVSRFPDDGMDAATLLRRADIAMHWAKQQRDTYCLYDPEQDHHSPDRLRLLSDFRRSLTTDEIVVHYQPIVDLATHQVSGAECLVRWEHPQLGLLYPDRFIDSVEQTGLIGPMTRYVLERSIRECVGWREAGLEFSVAVNLSVRNLSDARLAEDLERMLQRYSLPAAALRLEITESMIMSDPERAMLTVAELSRLGVRLAVDDFGTGHSSLANLRRLPIDELKIDRSFVTPMLRDENDLIIVRSTINMAHDLGLKTVAEGVEDFSTLSELDELGCDQVQGFHFSRPVPAESFLSWVQSFNGHTIEH